MTKCLRTLTFLLAVMHGIAFSCSSSMAQEFVRAPNQSFYLDLDSKDGTFSKWQLNDTALLSRLRARVRVRRLGQDRKWVPVFSIYVQNRDPGQDTPKHRAGVQLLAPQRMAPLVVRLARLDDGQFKYEGGFERLVDVGEKVDIELDWGTPNILKITKGKETQKLNVPWPIDSVVIEGSTGELQVEPLELGSTASSHRVSPGSRPLFAPTWFSGITPAVRPPAACRLPCGNSVNPSSRLTSIYSA